MKTVEMYGILVSGKKETWETLMKALPRQGESERENHEISTCKAEGFDADLNKSAFPWRQVVKEIQNRYAWREAGGTLVFDRKMEKMKKEEKNP